MSNGTKMTIKDFAPSSPPKGSGFHRYIFLAFLANEDLVHLEKVSKRSQFHIAEYAKQNKLGELVAANFYMTEAK